MTRRPLLPCACGSRMWRFPALHAIRLRRHQHRRDRSSRACLEARSVCEFPRQAGDAGGLRDGAGGAVCGGALGLPVPDGRARRLRAILLEYGTTLVARTGLGRRCWRHTGWQSGECGERRPMWGSTLDRSGRAEVEQPGLTGALLSGGAGGSGCWAGRSRRRWPAGVPGGSDQRGACLIRLADARGTGAVGGGGAGAGGTGGTVRGAALQGARRLVTVDTGCSPYATAAWRPGRKPGRLPSGRRVRLSRASPPPPVFAAWDAPRPVILSNIFDAHVKTFLTIGVHAPPCITLASVLERDFR